MIRLKGRTRTERGAVAIMVGLLSVVLFGTAALAVDLGNAWARKRAVQKQVDVSALAAGWMLPMTSANKSDIATRVASYLNDPDNQATEQVATSAALLVNGDVRDGEIYFQHDDGTACSDKCTQMRVLAPKARVDFGFASVLGFNHTDVQRAATVRVVSELPDRQKSIPFWLPTGCGYGPTQADTTQGNNPATPTATPTATATATATATTAPPFQPAAGAVGTHTLSGFTPTQVVQGTATTISGYKVLGATGGGVKKITLRAYPPNGTAYVDFAAETTGVVNPFQVSAFDVTAIAGDWRVWALAEKNNSFTYSANYLVIRVTPNPAAPTPATPSATPTVADSGVPVGCIGQDRGNFGQLDSPRHDGGSKQTRFARNLALGIDHTIVPYEFPDGVTQRKQCDEPGNLLPGAQLDDTARDGNNCIVGDTGNDGPKTYDGLVAGLGDGTKGRLDAANGATTCPNRSNLTMSGRAINNDVLSCFLRNGATLSDITAASGVSTSMIDPLVMKSPRFVWLPVVYATDRAQKSFQPIRQFVPGFITDETQTTAATSSNGLDINGNSIKVLHVFTFNRDVLPTKEDSETIDYDPTVGGAIARLVG